MAKKKKDDGSGGHLLVMVASTGVAFALRKLLAAGWTKVRGKEPPIDLTRPQGDPRRGARLGDPARSRRGDGAVLHHPRPGTA